MTDSDDAPHYGQLQMDGTEDGWRSTDKPIMVSQDGDV